MEEGVTKFRAHHQHRALCGERLGEPWRELLGWRRVLLDLGVVGQDPGRYEGAGFGNMSARLHPYAYDRGERRFLITGTQTGGMGELTLGHLAMVERYHVKRNEVFSQGEVAPSSEALTHGSIYDLSTAIRFVFHGHVPLIWKNAEALGLPVSHRDIPYGTPEMAQEAARLYRSTNLSELGCFAIGGHEDGVVAFGKTAAEAGDVLVRTLARAYTGLIRV